MVVCYVADCPSRKSKTGHQFKVPKNASEEVRQAWIRNVPERDVPFDPIKHILCEKHFEEELVETEERILLPDGTVYRHHKKRCTLRKNAVPTIFGNKVIGRSGRRRVVNPMVQKIKRKVTVHGNKKRPAVEVPKVPEKESLVVKRAPYGYFCQICLKVWYEETLQGTLEDRQEVYSKFAEKMTRHFQLEKVKSMCKAPVNFVSVGVFNNSLCNTCWSSSSAISKLHMELKKQEMKLDSEILKVTKMLQQPEFIKKKELAEKIVAAKSLHDVYKFNDRLITAGGNLASFPKVILKRVDDKNPSVQKQNENQTSASTVSVSEPTVIPTVFYGTAGIRSLLGDVIRCKSCDKCFLSQMDLQGHQIKYHPKLPKPIMPPVHAQQINRDLNTAKASTQESKVNKTCETVSLDTNEGKHRETVVVLDLPEDDFSEIMNLDLGGDDEICETVEDLDLDDNRVFETVDRSQNSDVCHQNVEPNPVKPKPTSNSDQISLPTPTLVLNDKLLETDNANEGSENNSVKGMSNHSESSRTVEPIDSVNEPLQQEIKTEGSKKVVGPRKVPYMSSKFIGKYRVVCKLKNIQTGETCVGVLGKSNSDKGEAMPKVLSLGKFPKRSKPKPKPRRKPVHQRQLIKIPGPPFICPIPDCTKQYDQLIRCRRHWRQHLRRCAVKAGQAEKKQVKTVNEQKLLKLKCPVEGCYSLFNMKEALDCHLKTHAEHPCQFCDLSFYDPGSLMSHEIQHKQNIKTNSEDANTNGIFDCPRCEGAFKSYRYLKSHYCMKHLKITTRRSVPTPENKLARHCKDCDHEFSTLSKYHSHRHIFHGETIELPHSCPDCDQKFLTENNLNRHRRVHTNATQQLSFQCHICPRMFHHRYRYEIHVKSHAKRKYKTQAERRQSSGPVICDQCGRGFSSEGYLYMHMRTHENSSGPKFKCPVCERFLISPGRLEDHMRTHSGERPFVCHVCGDAFYDRRLLGCHLAKKHPPDKCENN